MIADRPLRYLDVCSGYSACTIGWEGLGFECAGYAEIDPAPAAVLAHRFGAGRPRAMPDPAAVEFPAGTDPLDKEFFAAAKLRRMLHHATETDDEFVAAWKERATRRANIKALDLIAWGDRIPNFGDFTTIGEDDVGPIDLLIGGTPCQAFSVAGRRLGLDDPRGNLTLEFLALAKRLRPRWIVWENVPGILSHDDGRTLGTFLWILGQLGFGWTYRVLDSQYVRVDGYERAVPQRRKRVFVVGYLGAGAAARAVLFDPQSMRGDPAPRRKAGENVAGTLASRAGGGGHPDGGDGRHDQLVAGPICARAGGGGLGTDFEVDGGLIAPPIRAAFGGNNESGPLDVATACNAHPGGRQDFGTETFVVSAQEAGMVPAVAPILRAEGFDASKDGTGRGTPLVPVVAPTLRAGGNVGGGDRPPGTDVDTIESLVPIAFRTTGNDGAYETGDVVGALTNNRDPNGQLVAFTIKDHGQDASADVAPTLRSMDGRHANSGGQAAIAFDTTQITSPCNRSNPQPGDPCHALAKSGHPPSVAFKMGAGSKAGSIGASEEVSPTLGAAGSGTQCSPGLATQYRVRRLTPRECERLQGAPDDHTLVPYVRGKPMADGPRYKMIGNSQSANKLRWIGRGIAAVEAELRKAGKA